MGGWLALCKRGTYTLFTCEYPNISGHVVDHGCDTPVESFVVHSPNIGLVGPNCEDSASSVLNLSPVIPLCVDIMIILTMIARYDCTN